MKPNHYLEVTAWQYDPAAPIPVWVARKWHRLGLDNLLESIENGKARPGQWIVCFNPVPGRNGEPMFTVFTPEEFAAVFKPLPPTP